MRISWIPGLWLSLTALPVMASFTPAVSFYRTTESHFPSGQSHLTDLEKTKVSELTQNFYRARKDKKELKLEAAIVLRDLDLSFKAIHARTGEIGQITRHESPWYEFLAPSGKKSWVSSEELSPLPEDLGFAYVVQSMPFRKQADWKSENFSEATVGQRFQVLGFDGDFVRVLSLEGASNIGFLDPSFVILKHDFASFVLHQGKAWKPYSFRSRRLATLTDKTQINLSEIEALITRPEMGVINRSFPSEKLVPRSTVEILRNEWVRWAESNIKGHGRVFWKKQEERHDISSPHLETFTTEEILGRALSGVAIHPKNPNAALVSAQGIFMTVDGKTWKKLPGFQTQNLPVTIDELGVLYVGSSRSKDGGKTFSPFLRWEDLTTILENRHRKAPGTLRLADIKSSKSEQVEITVEAGGWKALLSGSAKFGLVTNWKFIKEN